MTATISDWSSQEAEIDKILALPNKYIAIDKAGTRVGATTSLLKRIIESGKRVIVLEPRHEIVDKTVKAVKELIDRPITIQHLRANDIACERPNKRYMKLLGYAFKGKCEYCDITDCNWRQTFNNLKNTDILAMTYDKLWVLCRSNQLEAFEFIDLLQNFDYIFMDEFDCALYYQPFEINIRELQKTLNIIRFDKLSDYIEDVEKAYKKGTTDVAPIAFDKKDLDALLKILDPFNLEKVKLLAKVYEFAANYGQVKVYWKEMEGIQVPTLIPMISHPLKEIQIRFQDSDIKIVATSAQMPHAEMFPFRYETFPDIKETEKRQLIVCDFTDRPLPVYLRDLKKYGKLYHNAMDNLEQFLIKAIKGFKPENVAIFCINKSITDKVRDIIYNHKELEGVVVREYDEMRTSYYRSETSIGVPFEQRIMLCICGPETPLDSFDGYRQAFNTEEDIRKQEISIIFKNTIGRAKCPEGKRQSVVMTFGISKKRAQEMLPGKTEIIETTKGAFYYEAMFATDDWWRLNPNEWDYEIPIHEATRIFAKIKNHIRGRHKGGFIKKEELHGLKVGGERLNIKRIKQLQDCCEEFGFSKEGQGMQWQEVRGY